MIKRVDRYVGRSALLGTLVVWVSLSALILLFNLMNELRNAQGGYGASDALWFALLTAPRVFYSMFPVAALLGTLVGVGGLAETNELVAFRTAGVSRLRLAGAAFGGVMVLAVPVMLMGEYIAPAAEQQARAYRLKQMVGQVIIGGVRGMWMRDGDRIINIQMPLLEASRERQTVRFEDVVIYDFGEGSRLESVIRAERARHDGEDWTLSDVRSTRIDADGAETSADDQQAWESAFEPQLIDSAVSRPQYLSLRSLGRYIRYLGRNGQDDRVYRAAFWEKAAFPLLVLSLVLAGMPFVFGQSRQQSLGLRLFVGMIVGGMAIIVVRLVENLAEAYALPPLLGVLFTPLLLMAAAIWALRRTV